MAKQEIFNFKHTFYELGKEFYERVEPSKVKSPELIVFNDQLAEQLEINTDNLSESTKADIFSGKKLTKNAISIAQAYAGHQFGYFTRLGDGRAHLLGEQKLKNGSLKDIQLKGSGPTAFSRSGDGRATLYSMLREYLVSEAMHGLKIPTSRSLAVVKTNEKVRREVFHEGAVLTRVMDSLLRVGTFEYAKRFLSVEHLEKLLNYAIERHYPEIQEGENKTLSFIEKVMEKQIELVVNWMRVGFIHGVMNTDNVSIPGQTFDYGPCAFMNNYDPQTVFSSVDQQGRYAYGNQPSIAHWNITVLAGTLLPLVDDDHDKAVEKAQSLIDTFGERFESAYMNMMGKKIGITYRSGEDKNIIEELLNMMRIFGWDYTNTFNHLRENNFPKNYDLERFQAWHKKWKVRQEEEKIDSQKVMLEVNPVIIPRNHIVEEVLELGVQGNLDQFNSYLQILRKPYDKNVEEKYTLPPENGDAGYQTYCGT